MAFSRAISLIMSGRQTSDWIQAVGRLIHDQDIGIVQHGLGETYALLNTLDGCRSADGGTFYQPAPLVGFLDRVRRPPFESANTAKNRRKPVTVHVPYAARFPADSRFLFFAPTGSLIMSCPLTTACLRRFQNPVIMRMVVDFRRHWARKPTISPFSSCGFYKDLFEGARKTSHIPDYQA